ncbi:site-specific DNA recombinase [Mesorhizobium albiziae]|uniref:Site-specific DNA recombinase n=1 Tax=Neomesorhizobium albiziae TaxID=335020 RepID=A0A1I4FN78_9HYPH|nr:serine recombinase [Mesorhizobium albiziae]SFL18963.1 site-specific DNA recombinase [Mesorhizobium albiziae]
MTCAAIYARVSSDQQKEDNTIASQTAALVAFAREQGVSVPDEWIIEDAGFSGASLARPGLERLRDLAAEGHIQAVLIHSPDRLSRKYAYQVLLMEEFARRGVETVFIKAPHADTPEDQLMLQFQGMIAEYERAQILERSRRGKRHRARAGEVSVLCGAPYGYRYIRKTNDAPARYEVDAAEAEVVRLVFENYTVGGLSIGALARLLNEMGLPTRRRVTRWERSVVWGMLRNPAYKGTACFGKTQVAPRQKVTKPFRLSGRAGFSENTSQHERPREEWIEVPVPAIVTEETFALAAERLTDNKRFAPRRTIEPSTVQGLVSCRKCGYALSRTSTRTSARKIHYYRCLGADSWRHLGGSVCDSRPIRQDLLDEVVWREVMRLIEDPTLIRAELDRRLDAARAVEPTKRRQEALERELVRVSKSMERLVTAFQEDLLSLEELRRRMPELRAREQTMRTELQAIRDQAADRMTFLRLAETLTAFLQKLRASAQSLDVSDRQRIVRLLVKDVLVDDDAVIIRHSLPMHTTIPPSGNASSPSNGKSPSADKSYLLRSGSGHAALRNTLASSREQATVDVACLENAPEKIDKPSIPHPPPHALQKQPMMNGVEVARQITFDDPASLRASAILKLYPHGTNSMVHAPLRPEAIGKTMEVALPNRLHSHQHGALDNTVCQGRYTQRS